MQPKLAPKPEEIDADLLSQGVDEILAAHGGDARAAVRTLLEQVSYLEMARNQAVMLASYGYSRGKLN